MAKIKRDPNSTQLYFRCPGCKHLHAVNDNETDVTIVSSGHPDEVPLWDFNKDHERPTINPSVLVRAYLRNPDTGIYNIETNRCHSFIKDGNIQFLSDCYHELAGQTVELPDIE